MEQTGKSYLHMLQFLRNKCSHNLHVEVLLSGMGLAGGFTVMSMKEDYSVFIIDLLHILRRVVTIFQPDIAGGAEDLPIRASLGFLTFQHLFGSIGATGRVFHIYLNRKNISS